MNRVLILSTLALWGAACAEPLSELERLQPSSQRSQAPPPVASVSAALPGQVMTLTATDAPAGVWVHFGMGSGLGDGICPPALAGDCLGIVDASLAGKARADLDGLAVLEWEVPLDTPVGTTLAVQAVVLGNSVSIAAPVAFEVSDPSDLCDPVGDGSWAPEDHAEVCVALQAMNDARAVDQDCGSRGIFTATHPLMLNPMLQEAAFTHASWMRSQQTLSHSSPGGPLGDSMVQRAEGAGYTNWSRLSENILRGRDRGVPAINGWLDSDGHCKNLMDARVRDVGLARDGVSGVSAAYWSSTFGALRR